MVDSFDLIVLGVLESSRCLTVWDSRESLKSLSFLSGLLKYGGFFGFCSWGELEATGGS